MHKGGSKEKKPRSVKVIRYSGLFIPVALIIYFVFMQIGIINNTHMIDGFGLFMFCFLWVFVGIIQLLFPITTKLDTFLRFTAFYLLTGASLIFISGVSTPFAAFWVVLVLTTYIHYSNNGLAFSLLALAFVVVVDINFWYVVDKSVLINDLVTLVAVLIMSAIILLIFKFQQISERELDTSKAQESLQRDRVSTIINNLSDAVLSTNMDGIIKVYNASSLNLLDTNISLNGHHIDDILPLSDQEGNEISVFKLLKDAKTVIKRDDLNYVFDADDKMRLEITFSPIRSSYSRSKKSETHDGYIIIMRDITKAKSLEEERDEFISVISHELRTPIAIAEGTVSNVQVMMQHPDATTKMLTDAVGVAHEQILFLASMVNDLSTLSRAERGVADSSEDINIRELANELHKKYSDAAQAKKLHLNLDLSAKIDHVFVSRLYLEELLQNLITNAIKYTNKGSVTIIIKQKADVITLAVKDTGIGISKSDQQKVFGKFYRSEDYRTRESSGTGLGLYVAQKLSHKIGTKIVLKSRLNFGSTFSITLPAVKQ
ncbi:MAG: ATP-binding protein [Candidatus Saccharibacteria bacterium]|nr:ATP-binding protein [Candidatus Saccharibacteria bacterium]